MKKIIGLLGVAVIVLNLTLILNLNDKNSFSEANANIRCDRVYPQSFWDHTSVFLMHCENPMGERCGMETYCEFLTNALCVPFQCELFL